MMGAQVQSDGVADVNTLTDANVYSERLKVLTEQGAYAKKALEEARAENLAMIAQKEEVVAINASTLDMLNKNLALEADLRQREAALEEKAKAVAVGEHDLGVALEKSNAEILAAKAALDKREEEVSKYITACNKQMYELKIALEKQMTEQQAILEGTHKSAMAGAAAAAEQAVATQRAAEAAIAAAEAKKAEYETRVAKLKELVG